MVISASPVGGPSGRGGPRRSSGAQETAGFPCAEKHEADHEADQSELEEPLALLSVTPAEAASLLAPTNADGNGLALVPLSPSPKKKLKPKKKKTTKPATEDPSVDDAGRQRQQKEEDAGRKLRALSYGMSGQDAMRIFDAFDDDHAGSLDLHQFRHALRRGVGISPAALSDAKVEPLFYALDTGDRSAGRLDILELSSVVWGRKEAITMAHHLASGRTLAAEFAGLRDIMAA